MYDIFCRISSGDLGCPDRVDWWGRSRWGVARARRERLTDVQKAKAEAPRRFWTTGAVPAARTEPTRYLCATTHLDERFAHLVVRAAVNQPFRADPPCYGADMAAVARHALAAGRRRLARDLVLLVIFLVLAAVWWNVLSTLYLPKTGWFEVLLDALWPGLLTAVLIAWLVVSADQAVKYWTLTRQLSARRFDPAAVGEPISRRARERLHKLAATQEGNLVVFGGYEPFVGSGQPLGSWSLAVDISKGIKDPLTGRRRQPTAFRAKDLYDDLAAALGDLEQPGLAVSERMYVSGRDAAKDERVLPDEFAPPATSVPPEMLQEVLATPDARARTYLCCQTTGWRGQLVVSTFVRAMKLRGSLFLEARSFALLPLDKWFQRVDEVARKSSAELAFLVVGGALAAALPLLLASPFRAGALALGGVAREEAEQRRMITKGEPFDYGAEFSIREVAAGAAFRRYFQQLDVVMYETVVQEAVLRGITEFLTEHGIDTAQVTNLQTTVNNGNVFHGDVKIKGDHNAIVGGKDNAAGGEDKPDRPDPRPKRPDLDPDGKLP